MKFNIFDKLAKTRKVYFGKTKAGVYSYFDNDSHLQVISVGAQHAFYSEKMHSEFLAKHDLVYRHIPYEHVLLPA